MSALTNIFTDIANALRSKMGVSDTFTPMEMAPAINNMDVLEIINNSSVEPSSSEGVIGYAGGSFVPIPDKVIHSEYGDIVINYNYNRFERSINQIFEVTDASNLFKSSANNVMNFDAIKFGNNITSMVGTFYFCLSFNQPITIGNNVTSMASTFESCSKFNQPITIPDNVTNMYYTFGMCYNFNQPITIPDSVTTMVGTFSQCDNFNQPITIPDSVTTMVSTFSYCKNFNQPVNIGNNVTNMVSTFFYCTNYGSSLYFKNSSKLTSDNVSKMFRSCNNSLRKNIYCDNATPFITYTNTNSIVGAAVTWSTMINGYYNATYNVYIYNNWTPT